LTVRIPPEDELPYGKIGLNIPKTLSRNVSSIDAIQVWFNAFYEMGLYPNLPSDETNRSC